MEQDTDTSLTTRMAKAIAEAYFGLDGMQVEWDDLREDSRENWRDVARAAINQIREA